MNRITGTLSLSGAELAVAFPFHLGLDRDCRVVQAGPVIARMLPQLSLGCPADAHFSLERPTVPWRFQSIYERSDQFFLLRSSCQPGLLLRGQMIPLAQQGTILFLGSPWITELARLAPGGLTVRDFALHDPIVDFLLLLQVKTSALADASRLADILASANEDLRRRVGERTAELQRANLDLQAEMDGRQRMERELRHAQRLEAVGQLASGVAHEINTPMQFIGHGLEFLRSGFQDLLKLVHSYRALCAADLPATQRHARAAELEREADLEYVFAEVPDAFENAFEGVDRVTRIVSAMNAMVHPVAERAQPADINETVEHTLVLAASSYKLIANVQRDLQPLPPVTCYIADLSRVFLNLIVNASHAIEDRVGTSGQLGTITVQSRCQGDEVIITFADTGTGIPPDVQNRVFDLFFTTKEVGRGTGQGLAMAHSIVVDGHGGRIHFDTSPDGTAMHVRLPIAGPR